MRRGRYARLLLGAIGALALSSPALAGGHGSKYQGSVEDLIALAPSHCDSFLKAAGEISVDNALAGQIAGGVKLVCAAAPTADAPEAGSTDDGPRHKDGQAYRRMEMPDPGDASDELGEAREMFRSASSIDAEAAYELLRRILGDAPRPVQN